MGDGAKLGVKRVDTRIGVVLEQLLKRVPKLDGGGIVIGVKVEELGGDPSVDPLDDREVILNLARIGGLRSR